MNLDAVQLIPWLSAFAAALCGVCAAVKPLHKMAAPVCITGIVSGFVIAMLAIPGVAEAGTVVTTLFEWIHVGGTFTPEGEYVGGIQADMGYYLDSLTMIMLAVVTGIGSLVAIYAAGYMKGDPGYSRFFAAVSLFIFSMTTMVMADNLVLIFLGWEAVGLASYLLIGHDYHRQSAVEAAKKAFIVNRVGDFGFLLGLFAVYGAFGSVELDAILPAAQAMLTHDASDLTGQALVAYQSAEAANPWLILLAPFGLMTGAFGKSAQIPLYVWLPDAMEGPTPVSALIHAATMVTSGIYLIARMMPVFELSPAALPTVAGIGGVTALFAATIALAQFDMKKVFAYSTVSQLGYMFLGIGALSATGAVFHLVTHAFFKALLFLTAGSVMHALAGQLDIRKISGLRHKMPITCWLMFAGCLALAGAPVVASGFWSKDLILGDTLSFGLSQSDPVLWVTYVGLALLGLLTAFLTGYYTFRVWCRVFLGPEQYEMGDDHHGDADGHHAHEPHEQPWLMNGPLVILAVGAILTGIILGPTKIFEGWIAQSSGNPYGAPLGEAAYHTADAAHGADAHAEHTHPHHIKGVHGVMMVFSGITAIAAIALAFLMHYKDRAMADKLQVTLAPLFNLLNRKYLVDELYNRVIVEPIRVVGHLFYVVDALIVDGLVRLLGGSPGWLGLGLRPAQSGRLHGYALGMAIGLGIVAAALLFALN